MAKIEVSPKSEFDVKVAEITASSEREQKALERDQKELEMGAFGRFFGSVQEKPGNIAGLSVIISMAALIILFCVNYFYQNQNDAPVQQLVTLFGGIVTLALGYLFGKSTKE